MSTEIKAKWHEHLTLQCFICGETFDTRQAAWIVDDGEMVNAICADCTRQVHEAFLELESHEKH